MSSPLVEVAEQVRAQARQKRVAAIFDLDSTLFCVSPRTQHILQELSLRPDFQARFPAAAEVLKSIEVRPTDWGVRQALERTQLAATPELVKTVRDFWRQHFFSSRHLDRDLIYPQASEYVNHLHGLGAKVHYLTGRSETPMRDGTMRALAAGGFPLFPETRVMMKPSDVLTDESFKADVLSTLVQEFDHIWFFENEPLIIELVRARLPQVHIVFVDSVHSGRAQKPTDLRQIPPDYSGDWQR